MLPHIPLFTNEPGCILLSLRPRIGERQWVAYGVTEPSCFPRTDGMWGWDRKEIWGSLGKDAQQMCLTWRGHSSVACAAKWTSGSDLREDKIFPHPLVFEAFLVFVPPVLVFILFKMNGL